MSEPSSTPIETGAAGRVTGLSHAYGDVRALDGVDLTFGAGSITALVGANGSGKSTLLRILAGVVTPSAGSAEVLGREPGSGSDWWRRVGYAPQESALDPEMTGREVLRLFAALHGLSRAEGGARIVQLEVAFRLDSLLDRLVKTYSGGERRRVHLALLLLADPELMLLDEPAGGLDLEGTELLWTELARCRDQGATTVLVTHDLERAERLADAVVLLDGGKILAAGAPEELLEGETAEEGRPRLASLYLRLSGKTLRDRESEPGRGARRGGGRR